MKRFLTSLFVVLAAPISCWSMEKLKSVNLEFVLADYESLKKDVSRLEDVVIGKYIELLKAEKQKRLSQNRDYWTEKFTQQKNAGNVKETSLENWVNLQPVFIQSEVLYDFSILAALNLVKPSVLVQMALDNPEANKTMLLKRWVYTTFSGQRQAFFIESGLFSEAKEQLRELKEKMLELEALMVVNETLKKIKNKTSVSGDGFMKIKQLATALAMVRADYEKYLWNRRDLPFGTLLADRYAFETKNKEEGRIEQQLNELVETLQ